MKIPTILKGDDSGAITISLPDGRDFTGATLVLAYGGVTRSFTNLLPGATLSFGFTHDETAGFKLGCKPVLMRLIGPSGSVETVENAAMKIKVTDCLGEVNAGGSFVISPRDLSTSVPVTDLGDLSTTAKIGDLYDKVNEIVRVLAQRSLLVLTLCLGLAAGADVYTARLEDLDRSSVVVTNVTGSSGFARPLPPYLHELSFDDTYPEDAAWYYAQPQDYGSCSAVRDGDFLYRNYDFPFDDRAEFVVRMSAGPGRFASIGVANCGTNLSEQIATSGKWSRYYRCLPGRTVDGINEHGVVAEVNVVGGPVTNGWRTTGSLHPLAAVRWVLDHAENAQDAANYLADNIRFPDGWTQNFHWMIADSAYGTYIVENGTVHAIPPYTMTAMTNFRLYPRDMSGEGQERYDALMAGANITSQWWTLTYTPSGYRPSDLQGVDSNVVFSAWANGSRESHRGEKLGGQSWWQTVHTSVYDITNRTLRVAVQETDDWYAFAVPSVGKVKSVNGMTGDVVLDASAVGALPDDEDALAASENFRAAVSTVSPPVELPSRWALSNVTNAQGEAASTILDGKRDKGDMAVYELGWDFSPLGDAESWSYAGVRYEPVVPAWVLVFEHGGREHVSVAGDTRDEALAATTAVVLDYVIHKSRPVATHDTLATTSEVTGKAGEFTEWDVNPYGLLVVWSTEPGLIGWKLTDSFGTWIYQGVKGAFDSLSLAWTAAEVPVVGSPVTATRRRVLRTGDVEPPGDYAAVSNAAMNAVQMVTNADANLIYTITSDGAEPRFYFTPVGAIDPTED